MSAREIAELIAVAGGVGLLALLLQPLATRLRVPDPLIFLILGIAIAGLVCRGEGGEAPTSCRSSVPSP